MAVHFYCPRCWEEIGQTARCPHCGFELQDFQKLSYEEKLLMALGHPVREYRMTAIRVMGDLGMPETVPALGNLLEQEKDYYVIREIISSLLKVGGPGAIRRISQLQGHPSEMVRKLARRVLSGVRSGRDKEGEDAQ